MSISTGTTRRLLSCLLSYTLLGALLAPPAWEAAASGGRARSAGRNAVSTALTRAQADAPRREGELLVRFGADMTERSKDEVTSSRGARRKGKLRGDSRLERLELQPGQDMAAAAERLRRQPGVEFAEPNFLVRHDEVKPSDQRFPEQWALRNAGQSGGVADSDVRATKAWQETTGSRSTVVAVVDSGVDFTHPDLAGNRWMNPGEVADNGLDDDRDGYADDVNGWDWVAGAGVIRDELGHGTAVAGVIAAEGDNGIGVAGMMWRASLMSLRVLDSAGTGDVASAVEAIDYAVKHGAQVVNCSWGTDADSQALRDAIERAGRKGVVVITSAGNSGRDIDSQPYYPASFDLPNLISVASSDGFDNLAQFSNRGGARVGVAAPGVDILTTQLGGDYRFVSGTSASAPLVAGIAGLIKTLRPNMPAAGVRSAVLGGARRVGTLVGKVASSGVADAEGALASVRGNPYAGNGNGQGGSSGNGQGNGRPYVPPALRKDNDHARAKGKKGDRVTPPDARVGAPLGGLPDLAESRKQRTSPSTSAPPATIHATNESPCVDCDPSGGGGVGGSDPYMGTARSRPVNEVGEQGEDLGSRNFNWGLPLVSLPGRAGLSVSIALYYNSLVWTKHGSGQDAVILYNADHGTPAPGFQLGMPRLQAQYFDSDANAYSYMMITPSGGRVEMRQVGTSGVYETADSTYTQLLFQNSTPVVRTTDGTQYVFGLSVGGGAEWRCTQIKDRNGNFITAEYDASNGHLLRVKDTLWAGDANQRVVKFNYNATTNLLESITQTWGGVTHTYATFGYTTRPIDLNFSVPSVWGAQSGTNQGVLAWVALANGASYRFDYNSYGQVYQIRHLTPNGQELGRTRYNLGDADLGGAAQDDCPRFTERRDWARYWNGDTNGTYSTAEEAVTTFSVSNGVTFTHPTTGYEFTGATLSQQTAPDGTIYKEYSSPTGWYAGLPLLSEVWARENNVDVKKKWTGYLWLQDDLGLSYAQNPRLVETNVYDSENNRRRTTFDYGQGYGLPTTVKEYGLVNGQLVVLRKTVTDYNLGAAYLNNRVIGLSSQRRVYQGETTLVSKVQYHYDWGGEDLFRDTPAAATQHDRTNYGPSFLAGRGNLSDIIRFNVNDPDNLNGTIQETKYRVNSTGSLLMARDHGWHATYLDYADSFSDGVNRNTFAYPTSLTDGEGSTSTTKYNYDFGAVTRTHTPSSGTGAGITYVDVVRDYYPDGRLQQATVLPGNTYQRWVYDDNASYVHTYATITGTTQADELHSWVIRDGAGHVRNTASDHPGSAGGFSGQYIVYDKMGRVTEQSNPTEIDQNWNPVGDDTLNPSQNTGGWRVSLQSYDWQGRPRVTTNADGTTQSLSYGGCGCAGGEVTTAQDEHGRQKRYTKDTLGRLAKVEELNWNGTVYSTTLYSYNARDQLTETSQQGQLRTFDYDGHGRLWHKTTPEQGQTTYTYYGDDTVHVITDARGATATYGYNGRHQIASVDYEVPQNSGVATTPDVGYLYDAAGNRFWMADGEGSTFSHYDALGRMDWEERNISGVGSYRLNYEYNPAGELREIRYPWQFGGGSVKVTYGYDKAGRLRSVGGSGYGTIPYYADSITYRAFGGVRGMNYGNTKSLSTAYDRRLRATKWDVAGVLGYKYYYDDFNEHTGRVTFAQHITGQNPSLDRSQTSSSLDRSYEYDNVGRLAVSHAGAEARAHSFSGQWGTADGHYSQGYDYDVWGNLTHRYGWGGEVQQGSPASSTDLYYMYSNNRRSGFTYDAAGNLTFDGGQHFTYDAQGSQVAVDWMNIQQGYDGDGLRVRRTADGKAPARYLRSSVLGGQVVAELNQAGGVWEWVRGYVYGGAGVLAVQQGGAVSFVHEDPVTKAKRVTDTGGSVQQSSTEFDPFGAEAGGTNQSFQPRKFTTYERDPNGTDEAMFRRYNRWHSRFDQPDPYDGSYDLSDPQSFNRYAYTQNDPVNFIDPSGLEQICIHNTNICWDDGMAGPTRRASTGDGVRGFFGSGTEHMGVELGGDLGGGLGGISPPQNTGPQQIGPTREAAREIVFRNCIERKKREAEQARKQYYSKFPDRVVRQIKIGAARGAIVGVISGGVVGAAAGGVGAVPGAAGGAVLGAMGGAYGGSISGVLMEPLFRAKHDMWDYKPSLDRAIIECDIEADRVL